MGVPRRGRLLVASAAVVLVGLVLLVRADDGDGAPEPALPPGAAGTTADPPTVARPADGLRLSRDGACAQLEYAVHPARQRHPSTWVLNVGSVPSYLDRAGAVSAIRRADRAIVEAGSVCGLPAPRLPATIYAGPTARLADVTHDGACLPPGNTDGINVVSFGPLPDDVVAVTCTYTAGGDIWQSDVMLNDRPGTFTLAPEDPSCQEAFDLQAVMTHERGHSFGLAHVPETRRAADLTMSSAMGHCDATGRTLGAGDVAGLARLY